MQTSPVKRALTFLLATVCGGAAVLAFAAPASAHAALTGTDPEDGAELAEAPAEVSATFSENLDGPSTEIAVTDPSGAVVDVPDPVYDGDTFAQPMRYTVPGEYTVAFRVISEDGHRVDGTVAFTVDSIPEDLYAPGAAPTGEPTDAAPTTGAETAEATEAPTEAAAVDGEDSNTGAVIAAILLGVLILVVAGVVLVKVFGRKKDDSGADA